MPLIYNDVIIAQLNKLKLCQVETKANLKNAKNEILA